jgi:hypothetical protein
VLTVNIPFGAAGADDVLVAPHHRSGGMGLRVLVRADHPRGPFDRLPPFRPLPNNPALAAPSTKSPGTGD